jgi:hypothetical protein
VERAGKESKRKECGKEETGKFSSTDLYETEIILEEQSRGGGKNAGIGMI